jgi:integral membrane protein (TIGR01906 family)
MRLPNLLRSIAGVLFVLSLPVLFATLSLRWLVADVDWQTSQFDKYGASERTGVSSEELSSVASHWSSYLLLQRDDIDIKVTIDGREQQLFNEREIHHMVDVRDLFARFYTVGLLAGGYALVYVVGGRALWGRRHWRGVGSKLALGGGATLAVCGTIALLSMANFSEFWTRIHLVSFDNDLWLLDPSRDRLIMMVPQGFWYDAAIRFGLATGAQGIGAVLVGGLLAWSRSSAGRKSSALVNQSTGRI